MKMILVFFLIIRLMIYKLVFRCWEAVPGAQKTETLRRNCKIIGSVLFYIFFDFIRGTVPTVPNNQVHLPNELKCKPRSSGALKAEDERVDLDSIYINKQAGGKKGEDDEIFEGLYTREHLSWLFSKKKTWVDTLRALAECYCEKIQKIIEDHMKENKPKDNPKEQQERAKLMRLYTKDFSDTKTVKGNSLSPSKGSLPMTQR